MDSPIHHVELHDADIQFLIDALEEHKEMSNGCSLELERLLQANTLIAYLKEFQK